MSFPPGAARRSSQVLNQAKIGLYVAVAIVLLMITSCAVARHSVTVQPGEVGVRIRTLGANAGVDPNPLPPGWHFIGIGERVVQFPTIQRTYTYTKEADERGSENEEITFSDKTGLPMTADVQIVLHVLPTQAPRLYTAWRLTFDQLFETPIRNDVRTAIAAESEKVAVDELYSGGRQGVIQRAMARVQGKWARQGVVVSQLDWIGPIRYPDIILQAIKNKTQVEQATLAAQAQVAQAKAQADARIEQARGFAESTRLQAEALRANPEVLRQKEIEAWKGLCPLNVKTCIIGASALTQVQADQ
jgi:regulator of protease activity HflC (stomatin/prohibitin superfamily)